MDEEEGAPSGCCEREEGEGIDEGGGAGAYTNQQIEEFLGTNLDLSFIHEQLLPSLPEYHRSIVLDLLQRVVTPRGG